MRRRSAPRRSAISSRTAHIRAGLFAVAATLPGLRLIAPAALADLKPDMQSIRATLSNGETIDAALAIAPTGATRRCAKGWASA